jgi:DnaK suppressor protein
MRRDLENQRDQVLRAIRLTIREGREEGAMEDAEVQDEGEQSEADVQTEVEFALLQMYGETLDRINEALARLEAGRYGICTDCGAAIANRRLEALPFATRCTGCEEDSEVQEAPTSPRANWRAAVRLLDMHG